VTASRRHGQQLHTTGSPFGAVLGDQMLPAERTATLLGRSGRVAGRELVRELVERDLAQADLAAACDAVAQRLISRVAKLGHGLGCSVAIALGLPPAPTSCLHCRTGPTA